LKLPQHVAIIMDGNGRWAEHRGHSRIFGHVRGAKTAKNIISESASRGIKNLTLFTFSTENWTRPEFEVSFLMKLLRKHLIRERASLCKQNIKFQCIGDLSRIPEAARAEVQLTMDMTRDNTGMNLTFAISYGGRQEIINGIKKLVDSGAAITEKNFSQSLESSFLPDPDLIIRTSGETRISNFFLWQAAYSEIYFTETFWPDFNASEFQKALEYFEGRERRFGKTSDQVKNRPPTMPGISL
jgi:undecaprenyl diphosphate synthase